MENNLFETLQSVARRNVRTAWLRVVAAVIIAIVGVTVFLVALAPMVGLVGFAVMFIAAYGSIATQVKNLARARARVRTLVAG